ncbi:MAG TPA: hypothetical protein VNT79_18060, partial [Phycisphaerae bacterium]|nr:hypothetical protein [Phycisphaerae bacterium]
CALVMLAGLMLGSESTCDQTITPPSNALAIRLEHATPSVFIVNVYSGQPGDDSASALLIKSISVGPNSMSMGSLACDPANAAGAFFMKTQVEADTTTTEPAARTKAAAASKSVILTGEGTGTSGFDGGSIGEEGQRYLLRGSHYDCGETILVRIEDDESDTGATPIAIVERYGSGEVIPDRGLDFDTNANENANSNENANANTNSNTNENNNANGNDNANENTNSNENNNENDNTSEPELVSVTIVNHTADFIRVTFDFLAEGEDSDAVTLAPLATTDGQVFCDTEILVAATTRAALADGAATAPIVLTGDGTGTGGFDGGTIGAMGERLIIQSTHFECEDQITIDITGAGTPHANPLDATPGAGTITIVSAS